MPNRQFKVSDIALPQRICYGILVLYPISYIKRLILVVTEYLKHQNHDSVMIRNGLTVLVFHATNLTLLLETRNEEQIGHIKHLQL